MINQNTYCSHLCLLKSVKYSKQYAYRTYVGYIISTQRKVRNRHNKGTVRALWFIPFCHKQYRAKKHRHLLERIKNGSLVKKELASSTRKEEKGDVGNYLIDSQHHNDRYKINP